MYKVIVEGFYKDDNFVTKVTDINKKNIKRLKKISKALLKEGLSNWSDNIVELYIDTEILTHSDLEWIDAIVPDGSKNHWIHTITGITLLKVEKSKKLL